jgi:hypothetical protein
MSITWTPIATQPPFQNIAFDSFSATFSVNLGTVVASDLVIVEVLNQNAQTTQITSLTVNGTAAALLLNDGATGGPILSFFGATGITSASASIVVTGNEGLGDVGILVGVLAGANNTPTSPFGFTEAGDAIPDPQEVQSGSPVIPASGIGIVEFGEVNGSTSPTSIANFTQDALTNFTGGSDASGDVMLIGHSTTAGAWNPQINGYAFDGGGMLAMTFGPASGGGASNFVPFNPWPQIGPLVAQ